MPTLAVFLPLIASAALHLQDQNDHLYNLQDFLLGSPQNSLTIHPFLSP